MAVFAVRLKRIAVSGLKLDEKSFGHGLRALKCLLLLESVKAGKKAGLGGPILASFTDLRKSKHFRALGL